MLQIINGKFDELVDDFRECGVELVFFKDIQEEKLDLPETSELLFENARIKAIAAAKHSGMYALGDDSGVFVEAIDWFPGVHSRRWTGEEEDDSLRNQRIIQMLEEQNDSNRKATLVSRFAIAGPDGNIIAEEKTSNVFNISTSERGNYGFAYDRILEVSPEWTNVTRKDLIKFQHATGYIRDNFKDHLPTIAELPQDIKNDFNQRGHIIARSIKNKILKWEEQHEKN